MVLLENSPQVAPPTFSSTRPAHGVRLPVLKYLTYTAGEVAAKESGKCLPAPPGWDGKGLEAAVFGSAQQPRRSGGPASFGQGGILPRLCWTPATLMKRGVNRQSLHA